MTDHILSYAAHFPPANWGYIQEQRGEDSTSEPWQGTTVEYHAMPQKAIDDFMDHLHFDHQTVKTANGFCLDSPGACSSCRAPHSADRL